MKERNTREYIMRGAFDQAELRRREAMCVHGEPPFCSAQCPIHLDARGLCASIEVGDFAAGRKLIEKVTPFVNILSSCCEEPCNAACKRTECGGGLELRALEKACADFAPSATRRILPTKSKGKSVAIAGSSLFCLALAYELSVKAYDVRLFCEHPTLTDALSAVFPDLAPTMLESDLEPLLAQPVQFEFDARIDAGLITRLRGEYDYFCLSAESLKALAGGIEAELVTLLTPDGMIAPYKSGVVYSLKEAKSAATTIDRLSQSIDPASSRIKEGSFETALLVTIDDVESKEPVAPEDSGYTKDGAMREAARCLACECTECIKGCVYLSDYNRNPKQMLREYYNNLSIVMGNHMANTMINSCSLCGLCKEVCPHGFDLPYACEAARRAMVETGKMPPSAHEFALLDMQFSNSDEYFTVIHDSDFMLSKFVFFPGCQAGAIIPKTILKTYEYLRSSLDGGVDIILGCCGMPAYWGGHTEMFDEAIEVISKAWQNLGCPTVITACPNCMSVFKDKLTEDVLGIWNVIDPENLSVSGTSGDLYVHDSCGARHDFKTQADVRSLASSMGYQLHETKYSKSETACCGFGGLVSYANREVSGHMARFAAQDGQRNLVYCANCRDRFMKEGRESVHLLELIFGVEGTKSPDLSLRRKNRKMLKSEIIKLHGGSPAVEKKQDYILNISESVKAVMDDRMILESDLESVIENARNGGGVVFDSQTGEYAANHRVGNVTFWVRYIVDGEAYNITAVYSHRMTVRKL